MSYPLRKQGPRTFISYAFGNTLARDIADKLERKGFQVVLVSDTTLLGRPSLKDALRSLIAQSELVVPVLCEKSSQSEWVRFEIETAIASGHRIVPVVQNAPLLPQRVRDIPYIHEMGPQFSEASLLALTGAALQSFGCLALDPAEPYQLEAEGLISYVNSQAPLLRILLDVDDFSGHLAEEVAPAIVEATRQQPELRESVNRQVTGAIDRLRRYLDQAQSLMANFRVAIDAAVQNFGADRERRKVLSWQRSFRLLLGAPLMNIAMVLPADRYPELWGRSVEGIRTLCQETTRTKEDTSFLGEESFPWAMSFFNDEFHRLNNHVEPRKWLDLELGTPQGQVARMYFPATQSSIRGTERRDKPSWFIEPYEWVGYCLPQMFVRRVMECAYLNSNSENSMPLLLSAYSGSAIAWSFPRVV